MKMKNIRISSTTFVTFATLITSIPWAHAAAVYVAPPSQLECSLKSMNPAGESQILQTKSIALASSNPKAEIALTQGTYSAKANIDQTSSLDVFFIDVADSATGRESGLQTTSAALRAGELSATLKVADDGSWIYAECSIKN